jgi:type III restriction enzyme
MSLEIKNSDYVLEIVDTDTSITDTLNKYNTFLDALSDEDYSFQREAIKNILKLFLSSKYTILSDLVKENYYKNNLLKAKFPNIDTYLEKIYLKDKMACSIDLATGTGKSFVMYGLAVIALSENLVDKVLVLCPSLTIEEGLKEKFVSLNSNSHLQSIIKELNPGYIQPEIVNATETILNNQICIENIHATYSRTGSSINESFKGEGQRVLVINDEAHHIFSGSVDTSTKKWLDFLLDKTYQFGFIANLTGTPYYMGSDQYFYDVVYRFPLKEAVESGIVKKIDYKISDEYGEEKHFEDTYQVHQKNIEKYGQYIKPITIIITDKIKTAIQTWRELLDYLITKEGISEEEAKQKTIWVTSSVPKNDKTYIESLVRPEEGSTIEKIRKENLNLLKTVDESSNPVEWIVSVSMLTEGWDVKNVFQIVPHETRAFNSRLLISQVLGRGLRVPPILKKNNIEMLLKINNHEKWTSEIKNLYNEVLEIENKLNWGYEHDNSQYNFPLHNLNYSPIELTIEVKEKPAEFGGKFTFSPQSEIIEGVTSTFFSGERIKFDVVQKEKMSIKVAAANLHMYLKKKNESVSKVWTKKKIEESIIKSLEEDGHSHSFLSKENYIKAQTSFGPIFRPTGRKSPRLSMRPDALEYLSVIDFPKLSFNENSLKNNGAIYYTDTSKNWFANEQLILFEHFTEIEKKIQELKNELAKVALNGDVATISELSTRISKLDDEKKILAEHVFYIKEIKFKTPTNLIYVTYEPEIKFVDSLFNHTDLFDSFIKSADKGFYYFPYSYKPETKAKTHKVQANFNPDFFLKIKGINEIVCIEIKKEGDDNNQNRAKLRDGLQHYKTLNQKLAEAGEDWKYHFKFLSSENNDILHFFQSVKDNRYQSWKSTLMNQLTGESE